MKILMFPVLIFLFAANASLLAADSADLVKGRVVDAQGSPVEGVTIAPQWSANGLPWEEVAELRKQSRVKEIWRHEGSMMPLGPRSVKTDAEGRFSVELHPKGRFLLAEDLARKRGAMLIFNRRSDKSPVELKLVPLVRVVGSIKHASSGQPASWSCTYLNIPTDPDNPLSFDRIALCGSYQSRFEFLLPAGDYNVDASSDMPNSSTIESIPFTIRPDSSEIDLGVLALRPELTIADRIERAKAEGTWGNFKDHFGQQPPTWNLTDARGIARDSKLSDFKGKWICLYLWTPNCVPCLRDGLPKLSEFYRVHASQRGQFEVLALCCDFNGNIKSVAELEHRLEFVKKSVWGGKELPFPVLLDSSFLTYERLGLEGSGTSNLLLIDPEGRLVPGDLDTLAKYLDRSVTGPK